MSPDHVRESYARDQFAAELRDHGYVLSDWEIAHIVRATADFCGLDSQRRQCMFQHALELWHYGHEALMRHLPNRVPDMIWFTEEAQQQRIHFLLNERGVERSLDQIGECVKAFLFKNEEFKNLQGAYVEVIRRLEEKPKAKFVNIFGKV